MLFVRLFMDDGGRWPLVSVVIPAHNAEETIGATLESVLGQSYGNFEVIVVDDGSTDGTAGLVEEVALRDVRVRLVRQVRGGVAAARNAGIERTSGVYVAPIDADDVWHPQRLELHVAALEREGEDTGVVYSPYYRIDALGRERSRSYLYYEKGDVFELQLATNLVGNGSGMMMRAACLESVGCYDTSLHEAGAQGCEDYLLQLKLAHQFKFVCVPQYLIGYRSHRRNMSRNGVRMARSQVLMYRHVQERYGASGDYFDRGYGNTLSMLTLRVCRASGAVAGFRELKANLQSWRQFWYFMRSTVEVFVVKFQKLVMPGIFYWAEGWMRLRHERRALKQYEEDLAGRGEAGQRVARRESGDVSAGAQGSEIAGKD
ncbi:glycosyltransferase family 2 protein [Phragmitibacter flavus]|uniref:Glycosyltransferase family 2 protein n=1 Tax=Phragmitibacter flavus TaxID=2576071 RepID=A0A5R8KAG2_9BACT|nr:glycosyltransferase family 2 protein [Phragmitibacter flavus]TLD69284.1 glycosyltransferase family 2 protein [Phragmitibacter flavus]